MNLQGAKYMYEIVWNISTQYTCVSIAITQYTRINTTKTSVRRFQVINRRVHTET